VELALVDWNMPGMNGLEFVQAVRAEHSYDGILLMMVTTETEMDQVAKALAAGANEYVMKPFTQEVILEKLQMLGVAGY
jgi:two-component system chemotaxis response regulator CheY